MAYERRLGILTCDTKDGVENVWLITRPVGYSTLLFILWHDLTARTGMADSINTSADMIKDISLSASIQETFFKMDRAESTQKL